MHHYSTFILSIPILPLPFIIIIVFFVVIVIFFRKFHSLCLLAKVCETFPWYRHNKLSLLGSFLRRT